MKLSATSLGTRQPDSDCPREQHSKAPELPNVFWGAAKYGLESRGLIALYMLRLQWATAKSIIAFGKRPQPESLRLISHDVL